MNRPTRPKSAKLRTRPNRYLQQQSQEQQQRKNAQQQQSSTSNVFDPSSASLHNDQMRLNGSVSFPSINRPTSSLSRYPKLPGIQTSNSSTGGQHQQHSIQSCVTPSLSPLNPYAPDFTPRRQPSMQLARGDSRGLTDHSSPEDMQTFEDPVQPLEDSMQQMQISSKIRLKLRLPDGTTVEKDFYPSQTAKQVLIFGARDSTRPCILCRTTTSGKKEQISELSRSLQQLDIGDRSLLYLEWNDYDD